MGIFDYITKFMGDGSTGPLSLLEDAQRTADAAGGSPAGDAQAAKLAAIRAAAAARGAAMPVPPSTAPFAELGAAPFDEYTANIASKAAYARGANPSVWSNLTRPISLGTAARAVGSGALAVGGAAARVGGVASAVLPAAGVLASKMAGGDVASGLNPSLMTNALGEGYARYAPTWAGGLDAASVAAGDSQGASDIEGRFGAVPVPTSAAPAPARPTDQTSWKDAAAIPWGATPAPATPTLPPVAAMTAADIRGRGVPVSGTGGAVNDSTGRVMNFDTREIASPTAPAPMVSASQYDAMRGGTPMPNGGLPDTTPQPFRGTAAARFFGAGMNIKQIADDNAQRANAAKLATEMAGHRGTYDAATLGHILTANSAAAKLAAEAPGLGAQAGVHNAQAGEIGDLRAAALAHLATHPGDYEGYGAILGKHQPAADHVSAPPGNQPMVQDPKDPYGVLLDSKTHTLTKTPITTAPTSMTFAQAKAQAVKNPQYKYTTDAQLRSDLQASGKYKITD